MSTLARRFAVLSVVLLIGFSVAFAARDSSAQGSCGGEGQPGCGFDCQKNLVLVGGRCRHPACGRDGEAACTTLQRAFKSCDDVNPALVELAGKCVVRGVCGEEGQRACLAIERSPSCNHKNLAEVAGRCVHPACGRAGERPCLVTERGLQACDEGLAAVSGACRAACGADGQRACLVTERIPACDANLANQSGTCRHPACGRIGERACPVPERPGQICDTGLSEAPGCLGDCRGAIGTCFDRNLPMTEPTPNLNTTVPTPPAPDANPLRGFVDLHVHMFGNLGFGGAVQVGAAYDPVGGIAKALAPDFGTDMDLVGIGNTPMTRVMPCPPLVPNCGRNALHANHIPVTDDFIGANGDGAKSYFGAPIFTGWPTWRTQTHQQVYYKWLERAWRSGMRSMVMLAITNEFACAASKRLRGTNCQDSMAAIDKQLDAALAFEAWHRTQPGGGWFRIVRTPDEAEQEIRAGHLAVILGIESDVLFGCKKKSTCTVDFVNGEVDKYFTKGVRYIFPVHDFDTQFGGTALFIPELETANRAIMGGDGFSPAPCPGISDTMKCNTRGLTPSGTALIGKLMDKGMLIDIDHMSAKGIDETLTIAEQRNYPLFVGHGLFNGVYGTTGGNRHERMRTDVQLARLKLLGGLVSVMTQDELKPSQTACQQSSVSFLQNYRYAVDRMNVVAFGSDFTGSATHVGPRFGDDGCNANAQQRNAQHTRLAYPVKIPGFGVFDRQVTGQRTFDFNTDGLAHIGLYPDLLGDITLLGGSTNPPTTIEPLMKSAAQLVSAWRKAAGPRFLPQKQVPKALEPTAPIKMLPGGPRLPTKP
jgi:microsomal dipeptidase-like Zn-dependent dipeptidase